MERPCGKPRRLGALLLPYSLFILTNLPLSLAAQDLTLAELPSAPVPEMHSWVVSRPPALPLEKHRRLTFNKLAISFLVAGEALDSWTTYRNLTHPKWICGYSPAFGNAVTYISDDGKHYDPHTIQYDLCGPSPSGQLANYAYDVTRTGAYTETGWVSQLHLTSNRNAAGALAWNIADDVGQLLVARYLSKRRGLIGRIAPGLTFARGAIHFDCGIRNLQFARTHNNATTWQFRLPNEPTLYPAPRWWGRR